MFKVFKSHLKKQWIGFLTAIIFIVFAAGMLSVGISIKADAKNMFESKVKASNLSGYRMVLSSYDKEFISEVLTEIKNDNNITDLELSYELSVMGSKNGSDVYNSFYVLKHDTNKVISKNIPFDVDNSIKDGIYISTYVSKQHNLKVGDTMIFNSPMGTMERRIKGYYEEYFFLWSPVVMFEENDFDMLLNYALNQKIPDKVNDDALQTIWYASILCFNVKDENEFLKFSDKIGNEYFKPMAALGLDANFSFWTLENMRLQLTGFSDILSAMLIAFSFIMTAVSLIVIRFIIISYLEDDKKNVGIFKSLGFTTNNLRSIIMSEYLIIGLFAAIVGIFLSKFVLPIFTNIIGMTVYLNWDAPVSVAAGLIGFIIPPVLIAAVVWLITAKLKTITPIVALRKLPINHKVKRNHLPLSKFDKVPNIVISLKDVLNGGKKWISISLVIAIISFFAVFTYILHYNVNVDNAVFVGLTGNEPADVKIYTNKEEVQKTISEMPEVDNIFYSGYSQSNGSITIGDKNSYVGIIYHKTFENTKLRILYDGRYPSSNTDVLISGKTSEYLNLKIGDILPIDVVNVKHDFKVVGLYQSMSNVNNIYITGDGMQKFLPPENKLEYREMNVYAKKNIEANVLYQKIDSYLATVNILDSDYIKCFNKEDNANMYISSSMLDGAEILTYAMDGITAVALMVVLIFIIRLKLIRERQNIALSKSLGTTTFGIMTNVAIGTVIVVTISAIIGSILAVLFSSSILNLALSGFGVKNVLLIVPLFQVLLIVSAIFALTYIISMLLALGTKRISPRHLRVS